MRLNVSDAEQVFLRELGDRFRKERDSREWSIIHTAETAGLTFTGYARLERGGGSTLSSMFAAARGFGFDPFVLLERSSSARVNAGRALCITCHRPLLEHRVGECRPDAYTLLRSAR